MLHNTYLFSFLKQTSFFLDFRIIIFIQYLFIGGGDVIFWWTVWNIADYLNPIDVIVNGHVSFIHGYIFVVIANVCYLTTRKCFERTLDKFSQVSQQNLYPTSIVTITPKKQRKKTTKFRLLSLIFPISVYFLGLGFIHIWRGFFAVFYHLVDQVLLKHGINTVLSRLVLQLCAGLTLMFNQKNNTVNLCPTHKIFKFDDLQYLDGLFKMDLLNLPYFYSKPKDKIKRYSGDEQIITNLNTSAEILPEGQVQLDIIESNEQARPYGFLHHEFRSGLYFAAILKKFHKAKQNKKVPNRKLRTPLKCFCSPTDHVRINIDILAMISRSCGINFIENVGLLNDGTQPTSVEPDKIQPDTCLCMYVEIYQSRIKENEYELKADGLNENEPNERHSKGIKLVDSSTTDRKCTCGSVIVKKFVKKVSTQEHKDRDSRLLESIQRKNTTSTFKRTSTKSTTCDKTCLHCRFIHLCAYIYTIHYEHVFLNAFGAIFWSSTWGIFDTVVKPIFTGTAQDVTWLLLVAVMSHCINHLVLFRLKENSTTLRWRTFYEYLCGICTVLFWASSWHTIDIFALLFGKYGR